MDGKVITVKDILTVKRGRWLCRGWPKRVALYYGTALYGVLTGIYYCRPLSVLTVHHAKSVASPTLVSVSNYVDPFHNMVLPNHRRHYHSKFPQNWSEWDVRMEPRKKLFDTWRGILHMFLSDFYRVIYCPRPRKPLGGVNHILWENKKTPYSWTTLMPHTL